MKTLYQLTSEMVALNDILESEEDLFRTDEANLAFARWAQSLAEEEGAKLDAYLDYIRHLEMEATAAKAEVDQWSMKHRSRVARIAWLKDMLKRHLELTGVTDKTTARGRTIAITGNGGNEPIEVDQEAILNLSDEELLRLARSGVVVIQPMVNKDRVREMLKSGQEVPFAKLTQRGTHLRIR